MSDWITEYAEREWYSAAFMSAKDLEACLRDFDTKRLSMTHEPHITPSRLAVERMNEEAALARALELLAEREQEVARLSRECEQASDTILEQRAEIERLSAIVDKLPRTADGVPVVPGMTCWYMSWGGNAIEFPVDDWSDIATDWDDYGRRYYSTPEAARAAGETDAPSD